MALQANSICPGLEFELSSQDECWEAIEHILTVDALYLTFQLRILRYGNPTDTIRST
ncbi:hypothetical protein LOAG_05146 [Loa loa]|uniref:Uncharacterized protein n=1 Tax=Loa loa TaxID=7209 RepID=A0A1S0U0H9_LOALO|nr:hypothetical protein LOAG_05146 [Loa loa]EFO23339.1 hypothetical protein LOAG_05146 [Loa loa]